MTCKISLLTILIAFLLLQSSCKDEQQRSSLEKKTPQLTSSPKLTISTFHPTPRRIVFKAIYEGPEFTYHHGFYHDDAHMTSTHLTHRISAFLKSNYIRGNYYRLDLNDITIKIEGDVSHRPKSTALCRYTLQIPIDKVTIDRGVTSLEHKGTWVQWSEINDMTAAAWQKRIEQIAIGKAPMRKLTTSKGFREYWIQFKSKKFLRENHLKE